MVQTTGIEPATSGLLARRSATELHPRPALHGSAVRSAGSAACAGGDESSSRCAHRGKCDRERAYSVCVRLSQAALSWRDRGFIGRLQKRNSKCLLSAPQEAQCQTARGLPGTEGTRGTDPPADVPTGAVLNPLCRLDLSPLGTLKCDSAQHRSGHRGGEPQE
jgi:hypothetical protein